MAKAIVLGKSTKTIWDLGFGIWDCKSILLFLGFFLLVVLPTSAQQSLSPEIDRPTIQIGSKGNVVSELQAALKLLGYYRGTVDGIYTETLANSVSQFQRSAGLNATGIADSRTWETLFPRLPPNTTASATPPTNNANKPPTTSNSNTQSTANKPAPTATPAPNRQTTTSTTKPQPSKTKPPVNQSSTRPTQAQISSLPVLTKGTKGFAVKKLQQRLKTLGFFKGDVDGIFGDATWRAVMAAQRKFGLQADGIVGSATWNALLR
jgi:peptidoglycan hydrolase-like protein with peptidoglycan-binding domain